MAAPRGSAGDVVGHFQLAAVHLLAVAVAEVDHQVLRQIELAQAVAGGSDVAGVVVRRFATAHDDVAIRIAAGLVDGHLAMFVRRQEHVPGARARMASMAMRVLPSVPF